MPDHLPRIEHRHEPQSCQCKQCGSALTKTGEDITEQLDVKPAEFFAHRHIRPQYACQRCETVVTQLDSGSGKTHRATLWAYRSNDFELGPRIIVFDYQTSVAMANMRKTFSATGKAALSSTITPATNRCSRSPASEVIEALLKKCG